jgi:hypothetical protein
VQGPVELLRGPQRLLTEGGKVPPGRRPDQQLATKCALKRFDAACHRRVTEPEDLGCLSEPSGTCDLEQDEQVIGADPPRAYVHAGG